MFCRPSLSDVTIDDELHGTRVADNQVKRLGHREAVAEGHVDDCVCDVFHDVTVDVRFRRREEKQESAAALASARLVTIRRETARN